MSLIKPRLHQINFMRFHQNSKMLGSFAWHEMGSGKAQKLSSTVYTPDGPKTMGEIKVGDYVIGMDGLPKRVNAVFPQGVKEVFKITFSDGTSTECCGDHLWSVQTAQQKGRKNMFKVKPLKELIGDLKYSYNNNKWQIPITKAVQFNAKEIPIPAYSLGILVGDGSLGDNRVIFTNASDHIFNRVKKELDSDKIEVKRVWVEKGSTYTVSIIRVNNKITNWVTQSIKEMGLNTTSYHKFIPDVYKYNSIDVRLGILGGLLDTDGYVSKTGKVQFSSSSKKLVEDVNEVIASLGGQGTLKHKITNFGTDAWTTSLKIPNEYLHIISKPEKESRAKGLTKYFACRYITKIEPSGEDFCQCISVEDEHYLTDSFIVTHNTLSTLWLARDHLARLRQLGVKNPKFLIILPKSAISTWRVECNKNTPDLLQHMVIYSYSQLHNAIKSLKYIDVRMLVFDESHYLKSPETDRAQYLAEFLKELGSVSGKFVNGRILMLTGTPAPNNATEYYTSWALCCSPNITEAAIRLLDEERFNRWKVTFSRRKESTWESGYGKGKKKNSGSKWTGVNNAEMLNDILKEYVDFVQVKDCVDLPSKQEIAVDLGLPDDRLLADANIEEPEAYMALVERLARAKTPHMIEWVKEYLHAGDQQLIVFAMNRHPVEELAEKFPKHVRLITGAEKDAVRAQNIKDFQEGRFRVLAMTYKCGSESLNLQNCGVSLYHGYPWTDGAIKQAIARTWRPGQVRKTLHYFLTSGANDQRILRLVRSKEEATTTVENLLISNRKKITIDDLI